MLLPASRAVVRQSSRLTGRTARRFESTTTKATQTAKDTAAKATEAAKEGASKVSEYTSKASEGLSKVTSSAGPAIAGAAKSVSTALGKIGGRTGRFIGLIERSIPPTIYYARVGLELSKLVFQGQKMTPPPVSTFQSYFQYLLKSARNPRSLFTQASASTKATPEGILNQIRSVNSTQLAAGGVLLAEVLGFFTVGEIIGRMKLVGYRGDSGEAHH